MDVIPEATIVNLYQAEASIRILCQVRLQFHRYLLKACSS
jgi:hypothetical protein